MTTSKPKKVTKEKEKPKKKEVKKESKMKKADLKVIEGDKKSPNEVSLNELQLTKLMLVNSDIERRNSIMAEGQAKVTSLKLQLNMLEATYKAAEQEMVKARYNYIGLYKEIARQLGIESLDKYSIDWNTGKLTKK